MYWLRTKYKNWALKQGVEILKDDFAFIERILNKLPEKSHKLIMRDYCYMWIEGMEETKNSVQKQNKGRCRANIWLGRRLA